MSKLGPDVLQQPLVFVDIETNGLNHIRGKIIEIAVLRVEAGQLTQSFQSLVDPQTELPHFITNLTGISADDLRGAPTFDQIAEELTEIFRGAIFVAHNSRFDYSFIKQEFARLGASFLPKQLCTVKLSRALYPEAKGHKLADLILRHNLTFTNRHRAYDDAAVLWQFMQHIALSFPAEQISAAVAKQLRRPALPKKITPDIVENLPETAGVYVFQDAERRPLYIGKSINIKQRVLSHFGRDHAEAKEFKISQTVEHIEVHETPGELTALLLESELVKALQPIYNRQLRKQEKLLIAKQTVSIGGYQSVQVDEVDHIDPEEISVILAVYPRRSRMRSSLTELIKNFDLCPKLIGLEKGHGSCFLYQLHKCRGACIGKETSHDYNRRMQIAFQYHYIQTWPFRNPIILTENGSFSHSLIVDQWCIVGEVLQEYCEPIVRTKTKIFDLDTYRILQSFLSSKLDRVTIKVLEPDQFQSLMAV